MPEVMALLMGGQRLGSDGYLDEQYPVSEDSTSSQLTEDCREIHI
jgi:hypothetical protein